MQHRSDWLRERDPELYKGHLQFFGKQGQPVETIDTYDGCPDAETFAREYAYRHKPVLMRGCARTLPAFKWTDETMRAKADPDWHPTQELQKNVTRNDRGPFVNTKSFGDFLDHYRTAQRYLIHNMDDEGLRRDVHLPPPLRCPRAIATLHDLHIWMSSGGTESSLHFDTHDNMLTQIAGRKQVLLTNPRHSKLLYADHHDKWGLSPIHVRKVDLTRYPLVRKAPIFDVTVEAGDILFIPTDWWHQINSDDGVNIALTFGWNAFMPGTHAPPLPHQMLRPNATATAGGGSAYVIATAKGYQDQADDWIPTFGALCDGPPPPEDLNEIFVPDVDEYWWKYPVHEPNIHKWLQWWGAALQRVKGAWLNCDTSIAFTFLYERDGHRFDFENATYTYTDLWKDKRDTELVLEFMNRAAMAKILELPDPYARINAFFDQVHSGYVRAAGTGSSQYRGALMENWPRCFGAIGHALHRVEHKEGMHPVDNYWPPFFENEEDTRTDSAEDSDEEDEEERDDTDYHDEGEL